MINRVGTFICSCVPAFVLNINAAKLVLSLFYEVDQGEPMMPLRFVETAFLSNAAFITRNICVHV